MVGIDVGGARKGFHAVALIGGAYAGQLATADVQELAHWCRSLVGARVIAIDAPCRWSTDGRARPCERELMQKGIWCFSSPTHQKAHTPHRTGYFNWMLQGEKLYQALEASYPLVCRLPINGNACFETFPHAITWHLCALTAHHAASGGDCLIHGEPESGLIIVPSFPAVMGSSCGDRPDCPP